MHHFVSFHGRKWVTLPAATLSHVADLLTPVVRVAVASRKQHPETAAVYAELDCVRPGSFDYTLIVTDPGSSAVVADVGEICGTFVVEPVLTVAGKTLPLDAICMQTVIPRCMGTLDRWLAVLEYTAACGYNFVHFTPVNQVGQSGSAYSLSDQLAIDGALAPATLQTAATPTQALLDSLNEVLAKVRAPRRQGGLEMGCASDVVWNHTAFDSPWLIEHPEAGYSLANSPHLVPAFVLDEALQRYSKALQQGTVGIACPATSLWTEAEINGLVAHFREHCLHKLRLWEYFVIDRYENVRRFQAELAGSDASVKTYPPPSIEEVSSSVKPSWTRQGLVVDIAAAVQHFRAALQRGSHEDADGYKRRLVNAFADWVSHQNVVLHQQVRADLEVAMKNCSNSIRWERADPHGPRYGPLSTEHPLVGVNFVRLRGWAPDSVACSKDPYSCVDGIEPSLVLACNGWIWGGDPRVNFAEPSSRAYFRRDVNAWGDSVKLRYGEGPSDNPWLWDHMKRYTQATATMFDGLRIDNAHSTPVHVARVLLDAAREVNPNIFVFAELFTGDQALDINYVSQLGINALIREAMSANNARDMSRLVHEYGGLPIGSLRSLHFTGSPASPTCKPRALFVDCSHDNELPAQKFTQHCTLPLAVIVSMGCSSCGSNRGIDELITEKVDVVAEKRRYRPFVGCDDHGVTLEEGMGAIRLRLNKLHARLAAEGYSEIYVDMISEHIFTITRYSPASGKSVVAVVYPVVDENVLDIGGAQLEITSLGVADHLLLYVHQGRHQPEMQPLSSEDIAVRGQQWSFTVEANAALASAERSIIGENPQVVRFDHFCPGDVAIFSVSPPAATSVALRELGYTDLSTSPVIANVSSAIEKLDLIDINYVMFRCEHEEESAEYCGDGKYVIPNHGPLKYAGIEGVAAVLDEIQLQDDLAHPVCQHLRDGDWLIEWTVARLECRDQTAALGKYLRKILTYLRDLPRSTIPGRVTQLFGWLRASILRRALMQMPDFARSNPLAQALSMCSLQFYGLNARSSNMSVAAGLPHFSHGWMRTWGRDTFIALRGLFLVTGRFDAARAVILDFAKTLRHGLIPNLYDEGRNPRYNCRDAAWWFMQAVQDYVNLAPEGPQILSARIQLLFTDNDRVEGEAATKSTLLGVLHSILEQHVRGIDYREWNAGPTIDDKMQSEGFNVRICVDMETGFVHGGSALNCGTWMDKMGESELAGNRGIPATPRDGADVEIVGLVKSAVRWMMTLYKSGLSPHVGAGGLTFEAWDTLIQSSFERHFWIPVECESDSEHSVDHTLVHRRGIYKDSVGASASYADYQLRPNFCVAMVVAPELFNRRHAQIALRMAETHLLGGLGMRTLDPADWNYRPNYFNGADTTDYSTARGFNYHQGPEWLWPVGYFLRARLQFAENEYTVRGTVLSTLARYSPVIANSPWRGLPEICNEDGAYCSDGCPTQAWSCSCILDAMFDCTLMKHAHGVN